MTFVVLVFLCFWLVFYATLYVVVSFFHLIVDLDGGSTSQSRSHLMKEQYSNVKRYFQEKKDQTIMERILDVKDDWKALLAIRDEIEDNQL